MIIAVQNSAALYPPTVTPPPKPLPLRSFVFRFVRNPLLALPQAPMSSRWSACRAGGRPVYWVTGPELVEDVLIKRAARVSEVAGREAGVPAHAG